MTQPSPPPPGAPAGGVQAQWQAALDAGRFLLQRCGGCGRAVFFPRPLCPHCGSTALAWIDASGQGTVHAVTTARRPREAGGDVNVSLIDLDEGVRLMSRVEGLPPEAVRIGMAVRARVAQHEGHGLVVFDPLGDAHSDALGRPPAEVPGPAVAPAAVAVGRGTDGLRGSAAITGVATYGCGEAPGHTDMELLVHAAQAAVADAGLTMRDIDGLATASVTATMWGMPVVETLGLNPAYIDTTMLGGSSFIAHLLPAMRALQAGQCRHVLVCYGSAQRTTTLNRAQINASRRLLDPQPYEQPYAPVMPVAAYALAASRHMHAFGTTREQLAAVAVAARAWARLNPEAFQRGPLSMADVLGARMVSDPLTVRDCCLVTDGGGALVLSRADAARERPHKPVYVLGSATALWHRQISSMPELTVTAARQSGALAFAAAGLAPRDIDLLQLYDAFTINPILFLEDLGFCNKGEGGAFVQDGAIAPGGRLPVNTNGGGLSCVHPGMYGIFALIEAVRQLRGGCGERQVPGANTALAHGNGGTLSSQATAILGTEATL